MQIGFGRTSHVSMLCIHLAKRCEGNELSPSFSFSLSFTSSVNLIKISACPRWPGSVQSAGRGRVFGLDDVKLAVFVSSNSQHSRVVAPNAALHTLLVFLPPPHQCDAGRIKFIAVRFRDFLMDFPGAEVTPPTLSLISLVHPLTTSDR